MFEQVFFSGLALGSIYGLVALGFAVIFKATDVFNFAQGMFVVCGAYLAVTAISILQLPFPLAIVFIVGAAALLGVLIHMALIQPLLGRPMLSVIMLTIALSIALRALIEMIFGPQGRSLTTPMPTGVLMLGSVRISYLHLTAALVSWACMAGFGLFFRFTSVGLLMRASADSHEAAVVSGVNVNTIQPGYIQTEIAGDWFQSLGGQAQIAAFHRKRLQPIDSLDAMMLFFSSDASAATTGAVIDIDDGQSL